MEQQLETKVLDHLGLVSGMYDELDLGKTIDKLIDQDFTQRDVSLGQICKALVLNGLGFVERTLYMVTDFFENKPVDILLGEGIEPSHLNDSVLGRGLDEIHQYGCTKLYSELTPIICKNLNLKVDFIHMDSTDFHLDGNYNSDNSPDSDSNLLHLTKGYSRDHRPDLNQVVLNLITDNQAGIPLHMEALNGNSTDKTVFRETISNHISNLQNTTGFAYLVMDSAGYTQETINSHSDAYKWISRVPETIKICKEFICKESDMKPLTEGNSYRSELVTYGNVQQRWLVIHSEFAQQREIKTLKKNYQKKSSKEYKALFKLEKTKFSCEKDAHKALGNFTKKTTTLEVEQVTIIKNIKYAEKGRPAKNSSPDLVTYQIKTVATCSIDIFRKLENTKGKFVIATNELDTSKLPDTELFAGYKGQAKVERGFRFLKDPQFVASSLFVKKPQRVEALLFIMTLCLTVYAALEYKIRLELKKQDKTLPNQIGKQVKNPTTRWVFQLFRGIHVLYGMSKPSVLNINPLRMKIVNLMGSNYKKYYLLE